VTPDGRIDRSTVIGSAGPDHPTGLATGADGGVYVLARLGADLRLDAAFSPVAGPSESALLRFDTGGRCAWAVELAGTGQEGARAIAADPAGAVVVAGTFVPLWSRGDLPEVWVAKYGGDGARTWQRRCAGTGRTLAVDADAAGRVYLGTATPAPGRGSGRLPEDGWPLVQCFDERGGALWTWEPRRGPDAAEAWGRVVAVAAEADGGCRVLGEVRGLVRIGDAHEASLRGRDLFLARLDPDGGLRWLERIGGPGDDAASDLAPGPDGASVVTGTFQGSAFLDPWTLTSPAPAAGFVAEWDANGACGWALVLDEPAASEPAVLPLEVAVAADGAVWVAGWRRGALRLAGLALEAAREGPFLARVLPGGTTR
jgi:hypothetical protein